MTSGGILHQLARALQTRAIRVIDLTQTLSPDFPTIALPPEFGQAWPFRIEEISHYDERGPGPGRDGARHAGGRGRCLGRAASAHGGRQPGEVPP